VLHRGERSRGAFAMVCPDRETKSIRITLFGWRMVQMMPVVGFSEIDTMPIASTKSLQV
jgi:hypothetical protein